MRVNLRLATAGRVARSAAAWVEPVETRRIETQGAGLAKAAWLRYGPSTAFQALLSRRFLLIQTLD